MLGTLKPITWGHTKGGCAKPIHSQAEWDKIILFCGFRCFYCAAVLRADQVTKDHLVPLFRNGCDCSGNIVPCCERCNSMKKERTVYEFLKVKPCFVETTGKFYTSISALNPVCDASSDPLLKEIVRIAARHRFPEAPSYPYQKEVSWAWRTPR